MKIAARRAMPKKTIKKVPRAVTSETASQVAPATGSEATTRRVWLSLEERFQRKVKKLQDRHKIRNDEGEIVLFYGKPKEDFIHAFEQSYPLIELIERPTKGMIELGPFLYKVRDRLRPYNLYRSWLNSTGISLVIADKYLRAYDRYRGRLRQFAQLGIEKLLIVSRLKDCIKYVDEHKETIASQTAEELKNQVEALCWERGYHSEKQGRQGTEGTQVFPSTDATRSRNEGHTKQPQRQLIQAPGPRKFPVNPSNLVLLDPTQDMIQMLQDVFAHRPYELHQFITKNHMKVRSTVEEILAVKPDILIANLIPNPQLSGTPVGLKIAEIISIRSEVPIAFYGAYGRFEMSAPWIWQRLIKSNPIAFFREPFRKEEIRSAVFLALRMVESEKRLRLWEKLVASKTEELHLTDTQLQEVVSQKKSLWRKAIETQRRLQAVFDCAADAIFIKDQYLVYQMANPAMMGLLGVAEIEILGKKDEDLFEQDAAGHFREVERRVLNGEAIEEEYSRSIGGLELTLLDSRVPLRNAFGEVVGICGISRDVTERRGILLKELPIESDYASPAMRECLQQARMAAESDSIILLLGESGSGKDHVSRYIHDHSKRANGPFFSINCAAIPPELAESELFGHERGSYTGAQGRKRGLLELAEGGTLLLNEIGELSLPMQSKLLTFLDTRKFTRVGGEKEMSVNARIIAATNRVLQKDVAEGLFRKDLFYRLNVMSIVVPPLRERRQDIPILVREIVPRLCTELQFGAVPTIPSQTMKKLEKYHWPGNVRELRNVLEHALIISRGTKIEVSFPEFQSLDNSSEDENFDGGTKSDPSIYYPESLPRIARPHGDMRRRPIDPGRKVLQVLKQEYIIKRKWFIEQLAEAMNINRTTLSKWLTKHGLAESKT
jgi:PAS domain S-box-containing protein